VVAIIDTDTDSDSDTDSDGASLHAQFLKPASASLRLCVKKNAPRPRG